MADDTFLSRKDSPTQPQQYEPTEIYYKLSCSNTGQFETFETLEECHVYAKEWLNESLNNSMTTVISITKFINNEKIYSQKANTLEIAFTITQLNIELYKIKSTQFELTSDQICRINEIENEIKSIINI